ncbi:MAG: guanylate kinase [Chitinophagaceae bacterium]
MSFVNKLVIVTAPSGSGKSTIVKHLLKNFPFFTFSVSACTRRPRQGETNAIDYHFITVQDFEQKIKDNAFAEYEMVYEGKYYGTLKSELKHIWEQQHVPLIDIDVHGALKLKEKYKEKALSIFIKAPSIEELKQRLLNRNTDTLEAIAERIKKAENELLFENKFDKILINDNIHEACETVNTYITSFFSSQP